MAYLPDAEGWNKATKAVTLTGSGGAATDNLFSVTGTVLCKMYGELTAADGSQNITALLLEVDDGTAQAAISASGAVLTNLAVGTMVFRDALAATALTLADNAAGAVTDCNDAGASDPLVGFFVTKKTGAATYIRHAYSTTDAPIDNTTITWTVYWRPISSDGALAAV